MSTTSALLDLTPMLRPERKVLLELLRGLAADDWNRPTECPAWSVKGIALHILGDDLSLLSRQRDVATDGLTLFAEDHPGLSFRELLDGFNEQWVTASQFLSNELVIELLALVGDWSAAFYDNIGLDEVAREAVGFLADADPSPYWKLIAREYVERVVHQSQIRRAVGLPEVGGELVTPTARVIVYALAAWMRDFAPGAGSAIAADFGGFGSWTWVRESDRWDVLEDAEGAAARISVDPTKTVALLTRGVPEAEVDGALTISGDEILARGALEIMSAVFRTQSRRAA